MKQYKRNQIETAIVLTLGRQAKKPATELLYRLKRLLDTDRAQGRNPKSTDPGETTYAFYSADSPGSGVEIWFSRYEAFAMLMAVNLLEHGFPQEKTVIAMRSVRQELEREHKRILTLDPNALFDQEPLERNAKPGQLANSSTQPSFLVIRTEQKRAGLSPQPLKAIKICRDEAELMRFMKEALASYSIFELTTPAYLLDEQLAKTKPSQRGRPAS
jgi:hypothetical protein